MQMHSSFLLKIVYILHVTKNKVFFLPIMYLICKLTIDKCHKVQVSKNNDFYY